MTLEPTTVGAVFTDRASATSAADALRREGVVGEHVTSATWRGDRYVVEPRSGMLKRRGVLVGGAVGAVLGAAVVAIVTAIVSDSTALVTSLAVSGLIAGFVIGAFFGLSRAPSDRAVMARWSGIDVDEGDVLLVVSASDDAEDVRSTMQSFGGRIVDPQG
ncbi:MAG: hypothetical protein R3290_02145 [Acidimicrobiia bacterium]|nr:hypothetical protein [Acidimicrobiia bacterium]